MRHLAERWIDEIENDQAFRAAWEVERERGLDLLGVPRRRGLMWDLRKFARTVALCWRCK